MKPVLHPAPFSSGPSDAQLIARVLAGDQAGFRLLVERYQKGLFRVAYGMVLDSDVADDLVQDAFVRAYVNLASCKDRERFRFWLMRTLRNRALDYVKEKRRKDVSLSDESVQRHVESGAESAADTAEGALLGRRLAGALERLSPPLREAFVLRHLEEHSFEEIAELLGTGVSAVKMRVHRARQQLQEWLAPEVEGEPPEVSADRRTLRLPRAGGGAAAS